MNPDVEIGKVLKAVVINMFKESKETMSKKLKKNMMTMSSTDRESKHKNTSHKKEPKKNSQSENTVTEMKSVLDGLRSGFEMAEKRINKLKDTASEIIKSGVRGMGGKNQGKLIRASETCGRCIMGVPEGEKWEKVVERM